MLIILDLKLSFYYIVIIYYQYERILDYIIIWHIRLHYETKINQY